MIRYKNNIQVASCYSPIDHAAIFRMKAHNQVEHKRVFMLENEGHPGVEEIKKSVDQFDNDVSTYYSMPAI